jgi:osmoprotectant transport system ATP-binding protein
MTVAPVLRLVSVTKRYGTEHAIGPIDLAVRAGETTALIGPSGSGKTTVLRLFLGLVRPDAGEVQFHGRPLVPESLRDVRARIGYVVQDGGLFPHLTAGENVTLMARHLGWPGARVAGRLDELIGLGRLAPELLNRYPSQLSGGQRQRVGLLRALMLDPEVLLLDEPLGALDPMVRAELQEDLAAVFRALGKTVVIVTHDLAEAAFFAHDLVLLRAGLVVQRGPVETLAARPADPFVTAFLAAQRLGPPQSEARR